MLYLHRRKQFRESRQGHRLSVRRRSSSRSMLSLLTYSGDVRRDVRDNVMSTVSIFNPSLTPSLTCIFPHGPSHYATNSRKQHHPSSKASQQPPSDKLSLSNESSPKVRNIPRQNHPLILISPDLRSAYGLLSYLCLHTRSQGACLISLGNLFNEPGKGAALEQFEWAVNTGRRSVWNWMMSHEMV